MKLLRRIAKIFAIILFVFMLLTAGVYLYFNKSEPEGTTGVEADNLARAMMKSVNTVAWDSTKWVKWTFTGNNHYVWNKEKDLVHVSWGEYKVLLHTKSTKATALKNDQTLEGIEKKEAVATATRIFNNDSFWLNAPTKVFDPGTERSIVKLKDGNKALKVFYKTGGDTPGDAYLWHLDNNLRPIAYEMWVQLIPIGGVKATWENWETLSTGALIATKHHMFGRDIDLISEVKGGMTFQELGLASDPFKGF